MVSSNTLLGTPEADKAIPECGVWIKFIAVVGHGLTELGDGEDALFVLAGGVFAEGFDVESGGFVEVLHAWMIMLAVALLAEMTEWVEMEGDHTIMTELHLGFQVTEFI